MNCRVGSVVRSRGQGEGRCRAGVGKGARGRCEGGGVGARCPIEDLELGFFARRVPDSLAGFEKTIHFCKTSAFNQEEK